MISKVKENVLSFKDKKIKFRYNGSRNQIEEFEGKIINCYNFVFVIELENMTRSFSYTDVLIGTLEINI